MSVRNLRAMFENKTQESPPERGRSPGVSSSTNESACLFCPSQLFSSSVCPLRSPLYHITEHTTAKSCTICGGGLFVFLHIHCPNQIANLISLSQPAPSHLVPFPRSARASWQSRRMAALASNNGTQARPPVYLEENSARTPKQRLQSS